MTHPGCVAACAERTERLQRELQEARSQIGHLSDGQQLARARESKHADLLVRFDSLQVGYSKSLTPTCW